MDKGQEVACPFQWWLKFSYDYMRFSVRLRFTYGSIHWASTVWRNAPVHLGETVRIRIIQFCLQRSLHFIVHRGVYILVYILEWSLDLIYEVFSLWNRKSTKLSCMKYCCRVWVDVPNCYLYMWNRLQKRVRRTGPALAASLEPLVHRREWPS